MLKYCINNAEIKGTTFDGSTDVGGVVGRAFYCVSDCTNSSSGNVTGKNSVGGVIGAACNRTFTNLSNKATVSGKGNSVGGVVGYGNSTISNSDNSASVSGNDYVGGIVGDGNSGTIKSNTNSGAISANNYVGGIAGQCGSISSCTSNVDVTTSQSRCLNNPFTIDKNTFSTNTAYNLNGLGATNAGNWPDQADENKNPPYKFYTHNGNKFKHNSDLDSDKYLKQVVSDGGKGSIYIPSGFYVGTIAGKVNGSESSCSSTGNVKGNSLKAYTNVKLFLYSYDSGGRNGLYMMNVYFTADRYSIKFPLKYGTASSKTLTDEHSFVTYDTKRISTVLRVNTSDWKSELENLKAITIKRTSDTRFEMRSTVNDNAINFDSITWSD